VFCRFVCKGLTLLNPNFTYVKRGINLYKMTKISWIYLYIVALYYCNLCFSGATRQDDSRNASQEGGGTLGIFEWGCAAGTLEPLTYTRASSAKFCYPILE